MAQKMCKKEKGTDISRLRSNAFREVDHRLQSSFFWGLFSGEGLDISEIGTLGAEKTVSQA